MNTENTSESNKPHTMAELEEYIEAYIANFDPNNCNDETFIKMFTAYASKADGWSFTGDNGYCGHTAYIHQNWMWVHEGFGLELAYGHDFVKVFTSKNGGFWVPEYISLSGKDAEEIISIIKKKVLEWAGF